MPDRYPGYDVLSKRDTPSWNEQTRRVINERLALQVDHHEFLDDGEFRLLKAVCDRIVPQPRDRRRPAPVAAMVDRKLAHNGLDGYRNARLPPLREAWKRGLAAINAEAEIREGREFCQLTPDGQDAVLKAIENGETRDAAWRDLPPRLFFKARILHDIVGAYYAHPESWNEIGFGGPASPRGYVRMNFDRRDPWEASEGRPGREEQARKENARVGR